MDIVIHHNPACGTSRNVLQIIRDAGYDPVVIEYLETGWTRPQLLALFAAAGLTPRQALRTTKSPAEELGLLDDEVTDDQLLDAMLEHPFWSIDQSWHAEMGSGFADHQALFLIYSTHGQRHHGLKRMERP